MSKTKRLSTGAALRKLRREAGLSQHRLAAASGVSRQTIANCELGYSTDAHVSTIQKLARALGVNDSALIGGS